VLPDTKERLYIRQFLHLYLQFLHHFFYFYSRISWLIVSEQYRNKLCVSACLLCRHAKFPIKQPPAELWRQIDFSRWRPKSRKFTYGFSDGTRLKRSKSIYLSNFDEISDATAQILLLPVSKKGRPSGSLLRFWFWPIYHGFIGMPFGKCQVFLTKSTIGFLHAENLCSLYGVLCCEQHIVVSYGISDNYLCRLLNSRPKH